MCLYLCLHINPLGRLNNEEQNRSSTGLCQHWTIVCVWVLLCVHRQNGSIFDKLMYCLSVCVCVSEWQWSIDLTALPEGVHTSLSLLQYRLLIDCFQHCSGDVCQSGSHTVDFKPKSTHLSAADRIDWSLMNFKVHLINSFISQSWSANALI